MALRNQPYFPLYIQDYMTDEKLNMCSWSTQGIYIKILCVLHKQEVYGKILFKQNAKQQVSSIEYYASILVRQIQCQTEDMIDAINELIENRVLVIDDESIYQKRMVKDGEISETRSAAGKKGGGNPNLYKQNPKQNGEQKDKQNTENEIEDESEDDIEIVNYKKVLLSEITAEAFENLNPEYIEITKAFQNLFRANLIEAGASTKVVDSAKGIWIDSVRLMIESDGYSLVDLRGVYQFLQKDAFWKQNILSTSKLREQMAKLKLKMKNGNGSTREATSWTELAEVIADLG